MVTRIDVEAFLATQRSPRTVAAYRRDLAQLQEYVEARAARGPVDLERYREWLLAAGYRPSTIRRRLAAAAGFLRWRDGTATSAPPVAEAPDVERAAPLGLDDISALIGGVDGPGTVREGVACLLFASRVATLDGLLALGPEHLGAALRMTIDGEDVRFPRSMRGTLELLIRSSEGGRLFGGVSRQTMTRRIRTFAASCGVDGCTPQALRRSSGQITVESVALLTGVPVDPERVPPQERLGLISDAIRERLTPS
ncbi:MAG: site-specific integrase [Actinomycetota bacterium]